MPRLFALLLLLAGVVGCRTAPLDFDGGLPPGDLAGGGGGGGTGIRDMAAPRDLHMTPTSCCGADGNPGNELGVGKFCQKTSDCGSQKANICAATFSPGLTFCTMGCTMGGPAGQCGSGAQCECGMGQCACVPGECIMPPPGC